MTNVPATTIKRWRELVERLEYATSIGKLHWENGATNNSVIVNVKDMVITVRADGNSFVVEVSTEFGELIDSFTDEELGKLPGGRSSYWALSELFKTARRLITGADDVLDAIISELPSKPDEIPF